MSDYVFCVATFTNSVIDRELWRIEENEAIRYGVHPTALYSGRHHLIANEGESILDKLRAGPFTSSDPINVDIVKCDVKPGEYYPRIARPSDSQNYLSPGENPETSRDANFIAIALGQLNNLVRQLENICQIAHPAERTLETYGHSIRNLLILACTEVETYWRGVLTANGHIRPRITTNDYVALKDAMRLADYSISFTSYPWLESIRPFANWNRQNPTTTLRWYDAYNAVKHNREGEFERATLRHAFEAVTACAIMLVAQFGLSFDGWKSSDASRFFNFQSLPTWAPANGYHTPYEDAWEKNAIIWHPTNYPLP